MRRIVTQPRNNGSLASSWLRRSWPTKRQGQETESLRSPAVSQAIRLGPDLAGPAPAVGTDNAVTRMPCLSARKRQSAGPNQQRTPGKGFPYNQLGADARLAAPGAAGTLFPNRPGDGNRTALAWLLLNGSGVLPELEAASPGVYPSGR